MNKYQYVGLELHRISRDSYQDKQHVSAQDVEGASYSPQTFAMRMYSILFKYGQLF